MCKIVLRHMQEKVDAVLWRAQFMQTPLSGATLEVRPIDQSCLLKALAVVTAVIWILRTDMRF